MLSEVEIRQLCQRLGCPPDAPAVIAAIQAAPPARRVSNRAGNVSVRYPSYKMGVVIQAESHRNELAGIYEMEYDPHTLAYYDQPPPIKLTYQGRHGRRVGVLHTPDFFVVRSDAIGWEEWKTAAELERLAEMMPQRYVRSGTGWVCPPGAHYAAAFGFVYRVRSSAEIDWTFQRNIQFLTDYLHPDCPPVDQAIQLAVAALVTAHPGMLLADVLQSAMATTDQIYTLVAVGALFVDLHWAPLAEPDRVVVFRDAPTAQAARLLGAASCSGGGHPASPALLPCTSPLRSDPPSAGPAAASHTESQFPPSTLDALSPYLPLTATLDARELLARASPAALAEANRRYALIAPSLRGHPPDAGPTPARTLRCWLAAYRRAEAHHGAGYVGLLPGWARRGNRRPKLPDATRQLLAEVVTTYYETPTQPRKLAVYGRLVQQCAERGLLVPSYTTFAAAIRCRPRYEQTLQRQGPRAAYPAEPCYWELTLTTPRHGDRPFEIAHVDHTELDIELVCSRTGRVLGRPWATFLVDAYSRRLLATTLSFDSPSYRACMRILRVCVQRHGRLPQILVVDGGNEFASVYLEKLLARYAVVKKTRPGAKPRFGSVIERLFGTTQTEFIYNLAGNTQITRAVRQISPSVDPRAHARWPLARLDATLHRWADEVYDLTDHPALGQSPSIAFAAGVAQSGERRHRQIAYDDDFVMATLPTTPRGAATVQPNLGVKIRSIYYWCDAFRDPSVERTAVPVRYDPADAGVAYAFVHDRWVRCISEQYARLAGRSEREIQLATEELRRRQAQHGQRLPIRARQLAEFLVSLDAEDLLLSQRLRDLALHDLSATPTGGAAPAPDNPPAMTTAMPAPTDVSRPQDVLTTYEDY